MLFDQWKLVSLPGAYEESTDERRRTALQIVNRMREHIRGKPRSTNWRRNRNLVAWRVVAKHFDHKDLILTGRAHFLACQRKRSLKPFEAAEIQVSGCGWQPEPSAGSRRETGLSLRSSTRMCENARQGLDGIGRTRAAPGKDLSKLPWKFLWEKFQGKGRRQELEPGSRRECTLPLRMC